MTQPIVQPRTGDPPLDKVPQVIRFKASPGSRGPCGACRMREHCVAADLSRSCALPEQVHIGHRRLGVGEVLFRERQAFNFLYAVRFGTLKSGMVLDDGSEQVTGFSFAGDMLGIEGMARGRHATFASALEDSEVCLLPVDEILQAREAGGGVPSVALRLAQAAATELTREHAMKTVATLRQAEPRVAAFLVMLSRRMRILGLSSTEFELRMSRAEIGSYLGLTLESVSRALSSFAAHGWVDVSKRHVQVLSMESLEELCARVATAVRDADAPWPGRPETRAA